MGYNTRFYGYANIEPPLRQEDIDRINTWLEQKHIILASPCVYRIDPDADNHTVDRQPLAYPDAWNWIYGDLYDVEELPDSIISNENYQPYDCPSIESHLLITRDSKLAWSGREKSYGIDRWYIFIQNMILSPMGRLLNGKIGFQGDNPADAGTFTIVNGEIQGKLPAR